MTFADNTDIYFARQLINERLTTIELAAGMVSGDPGAADAIGIGGRQPGDPGECRVGCIGGCNQHRF